MKGDRASGDGSFWLTSQKEPSPLAVKGDIITDRGFGLC